MSLHRSLETYFEFKFGDCPIRSNMVEVKGPGHTGPVSKLDAVHPGRATAEYYMLAAYLGRLEAEQGRLMLLELAKLQVLDEKSPQYGAMRWYREETQVGDTNAVFFTLFPLAVLRLQAPETIPPSHLILMDGLMRAGIRWFSHEIEHPILYYSNKILNDGALLLALSKLQDHEQGINKAVRFFERWCTYTEERGWGWGENISVVYSLIIVNALRLASLLLANINPQLGIRLEGFIQQIFSNLRFQGKGELVPTIRSYNFQAKGDYPSVLWSISGNADIHEEVQDERNMDAWATHNAPSFLLFEQELNQTKQDKSVKQEMRIERIFDNAYATTWIGQRGRIGSINQFPVIKGCYQYPRWGLGWQSFPYSFRVGGEKLGFLRWRVEDGYVTRTHPAQDKHSAYLSPALFRESYFPDVQSRAEQNGPFLCIVRWMHGLHHKVDVICDEWVISHPYDQVTSYEVNGRQWIAVLFDSCAITFSALQGIRASSTSREQVTLTSIDKGDRTLISQVLYQAEEHSEQELCIQPGLESGWIVKWWDEVGHAQDLIKQLEAIQISDETLFDDEVPREPHLSLRRISIQAQDKHVLTMNIDPYPG